MESIGWLSDSERRLLYEASQMSPFGYPILNIGVEYGASLICLRSGTPTKNIFGVDLDTSKIAFSLDEYPINLIQMDSIEIARVWTLPIGLLFIDGGHDYATVSSDLGLTERVVGGGYLLVHDCYEWGTNSTQQHTIVPDVNKAVQAWKDGLDKGLWAELNPVDSIRRFNRL